MKKVLIAVLASMLFTAACAGSAPFAGGCTTDWDCANAVGYEDIEEVSK